VISSAEIAVTTGTALAVTAGTAVVTVANVAAGTVVAAGIIVVVSATVAGTVFVVVVCGTGFPAGAPTPPLMIQAAPTATMRTPRTSKIVELFIRVVLFVFG
jgi:hypothetical protein